MKDRSIFKVLIAIILLLLLVWMFCLACCEVMTLIFCDGLMQMEDRPTMLTEPEYVKVLKYGRNSAKLYYVEEGMAGGHVLYLEKVNGMWTTLKWDTIWSGRGGSASSVVFPYIWHFVYGGL